VWSERVSSPDCVNYVDRVGPDTGKRDAISAPVFDAGA
jgi:hypothetical protein